MNKRVFEIVDEIQKASKKLEVCQKSRCTAVKKEADKQKAVIAAQIQKLVNDFKAKKITIQQFITKSNELKKRTMTSDATKELMKCNLEKCEKEARSTLKAMIATMTYDCIEEKKKDACKREQMANKIINKKELTVDDFVKLVGIVSNH